MMSSLDVVELALDSLSEHQFMNLTSKYIYLYSIYVYLFALEGEGGGRERKKKCKKKCKKNVLNRVYDQYSILSTISVLIFICWNVF